MGRESGYLDYEVYEEDDIYYEENFGFDDGDNDLNDITVFVEAEDHDE